MAENNAITRKSSVEANNSSSAEGVLSLLDGEYVDYVEVASNEEGRQNDYVVRISDLDDGTSDSSSNEDYFYDSDDTTASTAEENLTPSFARETIERLPQLLRVLPRNYAFNADHESMLIIAEIAAIGALMPNVYTNKDGREINPSIMLIICGSPASGKGSVTKVRRLVENLDLWLSEQSRNGESNSMAESIILPGNSSNSKFLELLSKNNGRGLIFETEVKALLNMLNNREYGLTRETLLSAAEHEMIQLARIMDDRVYKIAHPELSIVATCVPSDIADLLGQDGIQSGLLSRCLFFCINEKKKVWQAWSIEDEDALDERDILSEVIKKLEEIYFNLSNRDKKLRVRFSRAQLRQIDLWLGQIYEDGEITAIMGSEFDSVLKRMPMHVARVAMVLAVLRAFEYNPVSFVEEVILVSDDDFQSALEIGHVMLEHTKAVFLRLFRKPDATQEAQLRERMNSAAKQQGLSLRKRLLLGLSSHGDTFNYQQFKEVALQIGYADYKTVNRAYHKMLGKEIVNKGDGRYALSDSGNKK